MKAFAGLSSDDDDSDEDMAPALPIPGRASPLVNEIASFAADRDPVIVVPLSSLHETVDTAAVQVPVLKLQPLGGRASAPSHAGGFRGFASSRDRLSTSM